MAFPFSAQGEIVFTKADGTLPSADLAIGRLDAAVSAQGPDDITRTPSSVSFHFNPLAVVWNRRDFIRRYSWDPDRLQVHRGMVEVVASADALRLTYDLDLRGIVLVLAVLIVVLIALRPPWELGLAALALLLLIGLGLISSATSQFRSFARRAVLGQIKSGPAEN